VVYIVSPQWQFFLICEKALFVATLHSLHRLTTASAINSHMENMGKTYDKARKSCIAIFNTCVVSEKNWNA